MAYFTHTNQKIYYEVTGTGEPLLLLHGNTASSRMFDHLVGNYAKDFKVILIDFPGHGRSDRIDTFETDFWFYNAVICHHLLDHLDLEKVSIVGTSGGALVAINLGLEYPHRIKQILADSFEGEFPLPSFIDSLEKDRQAGKQDPPTLSFWQYSHGPDWEKIVDLDTEMLLRFSDLDQSFFHLPISALAVPTMLTGSREDEFCDHLDAIYATLKQKNSALEIHLFEKGSHPAMLSNEEEFLKLVRQRILDA
jgi:pimeloyl-ACP methyl ester carboxylesterase